MTVGSGPKPIQTGTTLQSLCVTRVLFKTYKLYVHAYVSKSDDDLDDTTSNTATLDPFKGHDRCVIMDSAYYMGDIMALIGRFEWLIDMVGTVNENCIGADVKEED